MTAIIGDMGGVARSGDMHDDIAEVLITEAELRARVAALGAAITHDYVGQDVLLVGALRGALVFLADLARQIRLPLEFDTVVLKSYAGTMTTGAVTMAVFFHLAGTHAARTGLFTAAGIAALAAAVSLSRLKLPPRPRPHVPAHVGDCL